MRDEPLIAPSILSADFAHLADEVARVAPATDWVHVDVMDAHYVPNLTIGLPVVASLRKATPLSLDCHLMIEDPERWAPLYAETADSVTIHVETARDKRGVGRAIRDKGARAGIAVDKQTDIRDVLDVLPDYDMVLVMTIQAGFGGQAFIPDLLDKVRTARAYLDEHGLDLWLQVDGGVGADTIEACAEAGADAFVAGNAVYGAADPEAAVRGLLDQAKAVRARAARR